MVANSLAGLPAFASYFFTAVVLCAVFVLAYVSVTPQREMQLIREGNAAASFEVGMALIGFSIPLASAIFHAASLIDCMIWGLVALIAQLIAYGVARLTIPSLATEIGKGSIGPAIWLGSISLTSGVVSAACMSY
jgi:putative membrane protein